MRCRIFEASQRGIERILSLLMFDLDNNAFRHKKESHDHHGLVRSPPKLRPAYNEVEMSICRRREALLFPINSKVAKTSLVDISLSFFHDGGTLQVEQKTVRARCPIEGSAGRFPPTKFFPRVTSPEERGAHRCLWSIT